jgi:hypothetical protein
MLFWNQKTVARKDGAMIKKTYAVVVFENNPRWEIAPDNSAKKAG